MITMCIISSLFSHFCSFIQLFWSIVDLIQISDLGMCGEPSYILLLLWVGVPIIINILDYLSPPAQINYLCIVNVSPLSNFVQLSAQYYVGILLPQLNMIRPLSMNTLSFVTLTWPVLTNVVIVVVVVALLLKVIIQLPNLYFSFQLDLVKVIGIHLHPCHILLHKERILFRWILLQSVQNLIIWAQV